MDHALLTHFVGRPRHCRLEMLILDEQVSKRSWDTTVYQRRRRHLPRRRAPCGPQRPAEIPKRRKKAAVLLFWHDLCWLFRRLFFPREDSEPLMSDPARSPEEEE
ncbi:protein UL17 [Human betaherpesvirus 5]|uniref:Protein UL17 n=1 Tax=Human cytomegalovirus TaxID=10359 RepID=A0A0G2UCH7_HCMV|nr:protein UL17 [Human betaherpesvirus 5]